jgi:CRISPR/Cas system CMR subunit Cmr6 (Cas7 group RAMP superfamily)
VYRLKSKTNKYSVSLPRRRSRRVVDIQIVSEIQEHRSRETFRENVSTLKRSRDMQNTYITEGDALMDEVEINLNMLSYVDAEPGSWRGRPH